MTSAAAAGTTGGIPRDGLPQVAMTGRSNVGKSTLLNALCRSKVARTSAAPGKTRLANVYRVTVEGGGPGKWSLYLVDLPGYGYARGGADAAEELRAVAEAYFAFGRGPKTPAPQADSADPGPHTGGIADQGRKGQAPQRVGPRVQTGASVGEARNGQTPHRDRVGPGLQTGAIQTGGHSRPAAALLLVDSRHPGLESDIQAANWLSAMDVDYRVVATKVDKLSRSERARNVKALEITLGVPPLPVSAASGEGLDALWKTIVNLARTAHA